MENDDWRVAEKCSPSPPAFSVLQRDKLRPPLLQLASQPHRYPITHFSTMHSRLFSTHPLALGEPCAYQAVLLHLTFYLSPLFDLGLFRIFCVATSCAQWLSTPFLPSASPH